MKICKEKLEFSTLICHIACKSNNRYMRKDGASSNCYADNFVEDISFSFQNNTQNEVKMFAKLCKDIIFHFSVTKL